MGGGLLTYADSTFRFGTQDCEMGGFSPKKPVDLCSKLWMHLVKKGPEDFETFIWFRLPAQCMKCMIQPFYGAQISKLEW